MSAVEDPGASRQPPERLALVRDFVNSLDYPSGPDALATAETAASWCEAHGLHLPDRLTQDDCRRLRQVRERLRDVLEAHAGHPVAAGAADELGALLGSAPLGIRLGEQGWTLAAPGSGADSVVGALAAAIVEASIAGSWRRLKVCADDGCRFAFYDQSKNGSGAWCSMAVCGSRAKARAYRKRRRETSGPLRK